MTTKLNIEKSQALWQQVVGRIPCGTQTLSKAPDQFAEGVYPVFIERGMGSHVWDVDGNEFIDYPLGLGAVLLGHSDPRVNEAVAKQLQDGVTFSLPHPLEFRVAERVAALVPSCEMVRFTKTGSEATQAAIRIARAVTGRDHIAFCGYHGWHDWYAGSTLRSRGIPDAVKHLAHAFSFNQIDSLREVFDRYPDQIAAVIMEPVSLQAPRDQFLEKVRDIAREKGALLIFDEMVTGFRFARGGAQEHFGVTPDLTTMGKAIANGLPLNLVCGKRKYMKACEDVFFSSTFAGETLSLAAAEVVLEEIAQKDVIGHIWKQGEKVIRGFREAFRQFNVAGSLEGFPPRQFLTINDVEGKPSQLFKAIFWQECIRRGVLFGNAQFVCYSHTDEDIRRTIEVLRTALSVVSEAISSGVPEEFYDGRLPKEIFRRV